MASRLDVCEESEATRDSGRRLRAQEFVMTDTTIIERDVIIPDPEPK